MIKPDELESEAGQLTWDTIVTAAEGDVIEMRRLLGQNPWLALSEYWYTPAIHFAVREGHTEAAQLLLDEGAHPEWKGLHDGSLIQMASERGYTEIVRLLEETMDRRGIIRAQPADHPIHAAATGGDVQEVRRLLDADPNLVDLGDASGASPLHRAVRGGSTETIALLLDRGANVHAFQGASRGLAGGQWRKIQATDLAIWGKGGPDAGARIARLLVTRGATYDLTVAAALGDDEAQVRQMIDADPSRIADKRPSGRRPLSAAAHFDHQEIVRLLLERGADPTWEEPTAPKGLSLHEAAHAGNRGLVELLLAHGADPNSSVDSSGSATFAASTSEIRALLVAHGGTLDPYLIWMNEDEEAMRRVAENPRAACLADAFTTVCTLGKRELLDRLLQAGIRVLAIITGCQSYLLEHPDMLRTLLAHGMSPDLMNWQRQTLLHLLCNRPDDTGGKVERAAILLDAGANIAARDDEYRSTPLAWAARANATAMVEFLIARGAPTNLPDEEHWATPLAWADRRGHSQIASILRARGALR
jgi:ankyrin repeat protein